MFAHQHHPAAVVLASGEDSLAYLQSQWSCQLDRQGENQASYGLRLNRKGRILADGFVLKKDEDNFLIVSYDCSSPTLIELLEENLVADDVEFEDQTIGYEILSLWGGDHDTLSSQFSLTMPKENSFVATEFGLIFWGRKTKPANIEILSDEKQTKALASLLKNAAKKGSIKMENADFLTLARIESGMPSIPMEMGSGELPQECGLENGAVDFDKGCYLGQEVMARLHAMGKARRQTITVRWPGPDSISTPVDLYAGEKKVGELRSLVMDKNEGIGIALVHETGIPVLENDGLSIKDVTEGKITLL